MKLKVITHSGAFHGDEVTACAILKQLFEINIIRTRDNEIIETGDIVIDVGKVYDPKNCKFDHHQYTKETGVRYSDKYDIPMSSVGMVYREYGYMIIKKHIPEQYIETLDIDALVDIFYKSFILELDANDNGYNAVDGVPNYNQYTHLSSTINKFNIMDIYNEKEQYDAFMRAVEYASITLDVHIDSLINKSIAIKKDEITIKNAMKNRYNIYDSGEIIVVDCDCPNWLYCIRDYENKNPYKNDELIVKYIIYPDGENYRTRAIPSSKQFENRSTLMGIDDIIKKDELLKEEIIFIHSAGFIGGAKTKDGAIKMAKVSL